MAFTDKIAKTVAMIKVIEQKISDLKETYFSKIEELNNKLQELQDAIDEKANGAKGKAQKSMQYINTQINKIEKEYNDIAKGFNEKIDKIVEDTNNLIQGKIEGLKTPIAGELGSKLGLPPKTAEALASPVVSTLGGMFQFKAPNIKLPELNIPTLPV